MLHTQTGGTPLLWASHSGHRAVVKLLIGNGADTNIANEVIFFWCKNNVHMFVWSGKLCC